MAEVQKKLQAQKLTLNVEELAETLGLTKRTVQNFMTTAPHRLPPCVVLPGAEQRLTRVWRVEDVDEWLKRHRVRVDSPA